MIASMKSDKVCNVEQEPDLGRVEWFKHLINLEQQDLSTLVELKVSHFDLR